jgi:hypothetical protein
MKKILAVLLTICLCCAALAAFAEGTGYAGVWVLLRIEKNGESMTAEELALVGVTMTFTLNEDGTFTDIEVMAEEEQSMEGTWKDNGDGTITLDYGEGQTQTIRYEDGTIVINLEDTILYLTRGEEAAKEAA